MIRRFVFVLIILLVWILVIQSDRYFNDPISAMPSGIGHSNSNLSDLEVIIESDLIKDPNLQEIQSQYSSISTGMTYEEVSSIIGWQGILIYQDRVNVAGKAIETKVYQWNDVDARIVSNRFGKERIVDPYRNLTLEFQDDVLVELSVPRIQAD